jgi:hypothetical protein
MILYSSQGGGHFAVAIPFKDDFYIVNDMKPLTSSFKFIS